MSDDFDFGTFDEKVTVNPVRQIKTKEHTKSRRKKQREVYLKLEMLAPKLE